MERKDNLTKVLVVVGTVLAWLPLVTPVVLTAILLAAERVFRFDFLMPAELFPLALLGGSLLLWAAFRAHTRRGLIGWGLAGAIGALIASQGLAVLTGLASGKIEAAGWPFYAVMGLFTLFVLALGSSPLAARCSGTTSSNRPARSPKARNRRGRNRSDLTGFPSFNLETHEAKTCQVFAMAERFHLILCGNEPSQITQ